MAVWEAEQLASLKREDLLTPAAPRDGCTAPRSQLPGAQLYCHACLVTCPSQEAFENHCSSWEHTHMVAVDLAVPWEHRRPPTGLSKFELCPEPDLCEYGDDCTKAHSAQELREWVQRVQAAELREQAAWQDGLVPYRERLLAEYHGGSGEALVLSETVVGVSVSCDQPLVHQAREKKTRHSWVFTIHSEVRARRPSPGWRGSRGEDHTVGRRGDPGVWADTQALPLSVCVAQSRAPASLPQFPLLHTGRLLPAGAQPPARPALRTGGALPRGPVLDGLPGGSARADYLLWHL
uniref:C3H1-type domain-containing protein n=1 Tax=Prolemur simus TaxID=1328070 RepID=A0A8C8YL64_PROSS